MLLGAQKNTRPSILATSSSWQHAYNFYTSLTSYLPKIPEGTI